MISKLIKDQKSIWIGLLLVLAPTIGAYKMSMASSQDFVSIIGTLENDRKICPAFKLDSGETISLSGFVPKVAVNTKLSLKGQWRQRSKCMRGREFRVSEAVIKK